MSTNVLGQPPRPYLGCHNFVPSLLSPDDKVQTVSQDRFKQSPEVTQRKDRLKDYDSFVKNREPALSERHRQGSTYLSSPEAKLPKNPDGSIIRDLVKFPKGINREKTESVIRELEAVYREFRMTTNAHPQKRIPYYSKDRYPFPLLLCKERWQTRKDQSFTSPVPRKDRFEIRLAPGEVRKALGFITYGWLHYRLLISDEEMHKYPLFNPPFFKTSISARMSNREILNEYNVWRKALDSLHLWAEAKKKLENSESYNVFAKTFVPTSSQRNRKGTTDIDNPDKSLPKNPDKSIHWDDVRFPDGIDRVKIDAVIKEIEETYSKVFLKDQTTDE